MKTLKDLELMRQTPCVPFGNQYDFLLMDLENDYISKLNGLDKIKHKLMDWDVNAQRIILARLVDILTDSEIIDFNPKELWSLVK